MNPKTKVESKVRSSGTTESLRTTEKNEFGKIGNAPLIGASSYLSVPSVVSCIYP